MPPPRSGQQKSLLRSLTSTHLIALSLVVQVGLLVYANHVDSNPEKYGGLRYTDVDWRVVSDGAKLIFSGGHSGGGVSEDGLLGESGPGTGKRAAGWLIDDTGLPVGE
jgi:phosphatidylinositol glycan class M